MSRKIERSADYLRVTAIMLIVAMLTLMSLAASAAEQAERRSSESLHFSEGGRANNRDPQKATLSADEYDLLKTAGDRASAVSKPAPGTTGASASQTQNHDFWIFDADVDLFYDDDGDGYFYGIDLLFDADTIYDSADVYAAVYLSFEGGPWNEYAVTDVFTIFGASGTDEYVLVTELMSGYPTGEYDLLIELFDAFDGAFVASFGPEDSSELSYLPLEDFERDAPFVETRVTVTHGGGGATGVWMLLALLAGRFISSRR